MGIYNLIQYFGYVGLTLYGEFLQTLAREGSRDYTWAQGHLSDFGLSAMATSVCLMAPTKHKVVRSFLSLASPLAFTFHEYYPILAPEEGIKDMQDIACYFGGTLLAYTINEIAQSPKTKAIIKKINPKNRVSNKTLEKLVK